MLCKSKSENSEKITKLNSRKMVKFTKSQFDLISLDRLERASRFLARRPSGEIYAAFVTEGKNSENILEKPSNNYCKIFYAVI